MVFAPHGRRPSYEGRQRKFGVDSEEEVRAHEAEAKSGRTGASVLSTAGGWALPPHGRFPSYEGRQRKFKGDQEEEARTRRRR